MNEILEISREIDFNNLIYHFKGPSPSINFNKFVGPKYTFDQLKNGSKTLLQVEEDQKIFRLELGQITAGKPKDKSNNQKDAIKNVKNFIIQDKRLLIYLMIIQELDLKPFTKQNRMKQIKKPQVRDLKY